MTADERADRKNQAFHLALAAVEDFYNSIIETKDRDIALLRAENDRIVERNRELLGRRPAHDPLPGEPAEIKAELDS